MFRVESGGGVVCLLATNLGVVVRRQVILASPSGDQFHYGDLRAEMLVRFFFYKLKLLFED